MGTPRQGLPRNRQDVECTYPLLSRPPLSVLSIVILATGVWRPATTLDFHRAPDYTNATMFAFLVALLILDALLLSVVVLLQAGQGGGLASLGGGGTDTVLGGRQAVTILTKLSWWCGGIFMLLALVLSLVPRGGTSSDLQERIRAATPAAPSQQAPLPLGDPSPGGQPATEAPRPGASPNAGAAPKQAPLPLGTPDKPAPNAASPQQETPAPQQPRQ